MHNSQRTFWLMCINIEGFMSALYGAMMTEDQAAAALHERVRSRPLGCLQCVRLANWKYIF